jgi:lysozyme family protein
MSKTFDWALACVLHHEGGFVNNPNDPGGATDFGVSLRFLRSVGEDIDDFWKPAKCDKIKSELVAVKVFDMAVNMGAKQAWKLVQRAVNTLGYSLTVDGKPGPATLSAVKELTDRDFMLVTNLRREQDRFYNSLIQSKPSLAEFRLGWRRRAAF